MPGADGSRARVAKLFAEVVFRPAVVGLRAARRHAADVRQRRDAVANGVAGQQEVVRSPTLNLTNLTFHHVAHVEPVHQRSRRGLDDPYAH